MDFLFKLVFLISALALLPVFLASIYVSHQLTRHIRHAHPDAWLRIAPPDFAEPSLSAPLTRFVTQRTYRQISDPELTRLGDRAFRLLYLAVATLLIVILLGCYEAVVAGKA